MELYLPDIRRKKRPAINWTDTMLAKLRAEFPYRYNKELAAELNVSWRTLVRKARELAVEKEPGFLESRRSDISARARKSKPPNKYKGQKGWSVPGGEAHRFKPGHVSPIKDNPELIQKIRASRNETIRRDRIRRRLGLTPITKYKNL